MISTIHKFEDGVAICGTFPNQEVLDLIQQTAGPLGLVVSDPPYGNIVDEQWDQVEGSDIDFSNWMLHWTKKLEPLCIEGAALYVWGGVGRPNFRPFYRYLVEAERQTNFKLSNHITWSKKRAYGVQHNFLFTREELAYLVLGDIKKPALFNVPLLETKRSYPGYNVKYPAKSEFYRRTNVWVDITEILRGKKHPTEKPVRTSEIPIEIHTREGDWVLDPFAGSGTTGRAARALKRKFVLVEQDPGHFQTLVSSLS